MTTTRPAGAILQQAREERGLSLQDVVTATKISVNNLQAIETADYERLPADLYIRGFIRMYAEFLGLEGRELAERFLQERGDSHTASNLGHFLGNGSLTPKKFAEPTRLSPAASALILLTIILLVVGMFCLFTGWNPLSYFVKQARSIPASTALAYHPADPQTSAIVTNKALVLEAHFLKDTEVMLQLDGETILRETYAKESRVNWEANSFIHIEFAEPQSAKLRVNGQPLGFPTPRNGQYKLNLSAPPAAS
ncbi:MAG: helix-turn-helix domain-containing protein [Desulfobulbus sp.]|jgi:transcriptional regulator with XRE-family HTH domain